MTASRKFGPPYIEAMRGLSGQFARAFRKSGSELYETSCHLIQGDTFIAVSFEFLATGEEGWVPLEIGPEGWSEERRQKILRDAGHVLDERLKLEKFSDQDVAKRFEEVLNGLR